MYTIPLNPYVAGNPVGDSPAFVGRADVLQDVQRVLRRPQDNALVLYGQRRIGKTSILQHLEIELASQGAYYPVYFDLQDKASWTLGRVLNELARTIAYRLARPNPDLGDDPEVTFRQVWMPAVLHDLPDNAGLVLLFDEFDVLANPREEQAAAAFFPYLRNLMTYDPKKLQFVFVIGRNVADLDNIALALFKGIDSKRISLLNREATYALVRLSESNNSLHWSDDAIEQVWQLTHGHPFLSQQLCSHVWENAYDEEPDGVPEVGLTEIAAVIDKMLEASRNTLEWLWNGLPPAERVVSSAFAAAGPDAISQDELERVLQESGVRVVIRDLQNAPQQLQDWDILEPANGGYGFRVELLRRWIAAYKPLQRVQQELDYIEPVAQNFYAAAQGLYQAGELEQSISPLRQAISLNPNHLGATQLLAEILLSQNEIDEAHQLLERLYEYQPAAAHPRLIQVLLLQAQKVDEDDAQLSLYDRILQMAPAQPEAQSAKRRIWGQRGDAAFQADDLESALEAYKMADLTDLVSEIQQELSRRSQADQMQHLEELEQSEAYQEALALAREMSQAYPESRDWSAYLEYLELESQLYDWYQQALEAMKSDDRAAVQTLLARVIFQNPAYKEATRYLHMSVTGVDVVDLQSQLEDQRRAIKASESSRKKRWAFENLSSLLQAKDPHAAVRIAIALRNEMPDVDSLITAFEEAQGIAKTHLVLLLGETGDSKAIDVLQPYLTTTDIHMCSLVALALNILDFKDRETLEGLLMVQIPPGRFTMGEPPGGQTFTEGFKIDRFPLTNAQYKQFVEAGGYRERQHWSEDGWKWIQSQEHLCPRYLNHDKFNILSAPIVGLSWYEAEAYGAWSGKSMLTETQWERAARGDRDERSYPWGDVYHQGCGNIDSVIGQPTPVGSYPEGVSPYGCYDMAGNVWEWTSSTYGRGEASRVLRGGSWNNPQLDARCSARGWLMPGLVFNFFGVRLARML